MACDLLVSTEWLAAHLDQKDLRVIDVRGHVLPATAPPPHYYAHYDEYLLSHIPGAVFVDWTRDIVQPDSPSQDLADPEQFAALMSRLGIDGNTFVVAYDDAEGMFAARMWWALRYYGHARVAVLDGGWKKWISEGRPVSDIGPSFPPAHFVPSVQPELFADAASVLSRRSDAVLIDVRTAEEYEGRASRIARMGHIPGAINVPRSTLVSPEGTMPEPSVLRKVFESAGISLQAAEHIVYCNAGVSASYAMLALLSAGASNVKVYDGSWKDWGRNDALPVE